MTIKQFCDPQEQNTLSKKQNHNVSESQVTKITTHKNKKPK